MGLTTGPLTVLTFPQRWDPATNELTVRVLSLPRAAPDQPLAPGLPDFAHADLRFESHLVAGLDRLPRTADAQPTGPLTPARPPLRKAELFASLAALVPIDTAARTATPLVPRFRKVATESYRRVAGNRQLSGHLATADEYACALDDALGAQPTAPVVIEPSLRWGQVLALALRQPRLAEGLGLVTELTVTSPAGFWDRGGWVFTTLHGSGDTAQGLAVPFAAYLPPLTTGGPVFAAVQLPVDSTELVADHVVLEAARYADGHARLVHAAQVEDDTGDAIRLAWDDEQVAGWLNRQLDPATTAPMGTAGFRVDVREVGATTWASLCRLRSTGELTVGDLSLGGYDGEGFVEVVPVGLAAGATDYWLPPYFVTWRGSSVVGPDPDVVALHGEDLGWQPGTAANRITGPRQLTPAGLAEVSLTYGHDYEFRVRMVDLTAGGPDPADPLPVLPDASRTTTVAFRRRRRPGAVEVRRPSRDDPVLEIVRPRLAHPDILFTGHSFAEVRAELEQQRTAHATNPTGQQLRGLSLPDPDVASVRIVVESRALTGDGAPWHRLLQTERAFPPSATDPLRIDVRFEDHPDLDALPLTADDGALALPTARDLRLTVTALGRDDPGYFATGVDGAPTTDAARTGAPVSVELHVRAAAEPDLLGEPELRSCFLRLPPEAGPVARPTELLADELGLDLHGLTLTGRPGRRTVFGASAGLRHTLAPERTALTLSSDADTCLQWLNIVRVPLRRDWTWRGLAETGIAVHRQVRRGAGPPGEPRLVGTVRVPPAVATAMRQGLAEDDPRDPGRRSTELVFLDAVDPRPAPDDGPQLPAELTVTYSLSPAVESDSGPGPTTVGPIRLPLTTPPAQLPRLVSAGLAMTPFRHADDYSSTEPRRRYLWLELAGAPVDPGDAYFVRALAVAPDPVLTDRVVPEEREPALAIDPEWIRAISVGQPADSAGRRAMQQLTRQADGATQYVVPVPPGVGDASPELFGMYTYEIRVGHADDRWCTAQGRWGPPLRITGVQHPPPGLTCQAARLPGAIRVRAPFATPVHRGSHVRPVNPRTQLWAMLYATVAQADGTGWRNLLILHRSLQAPRQEVVIAGRAAEPAVLYGETEFDLEAVGQQLRIAGLPRTTGLTTLVAEVYAQPAVEDPLGRGLGHARLLRTSPLVAVPATC